MSTDIAPAFLDGLLRASWQATVLVGIVLMLQRTLRRWLTPRWRHALWLIVVARLLLPVTPASAWSVFNLAPAPTASRAGAPASAPAFVPTAAAGREPANPVPTARPSWQLDPRPSAPSAIAHSPALPLPTPAGPRELAPQPAPSRSAAAVNALSWSWLVPALWALGVVVLAGRVAWTSLRFRRALRSAHRLDDAAWNDLLTGCRQRLGVRRDVLAYEADWIRSPALCGWRRPRLLLPAGLAQRLSRDELRHVLLHELAHLQRNDILVNWLATVAQVLHWFNPVVWFALRRLRADRELAADHLALAALGEDHAQAYGQTILNLIQGFSRSIAVPAVVGILEDHGALRERIVAIAAFRRPGRGSGLAVLLVAALGFVSLTDAQPRPSSSAASTVATSGQSSLWIVDSVSGQPIAGASLRLQVTDAQGTHALGEHRADREGRVTLTFPPQGIRRFDLQAHAPGHVPRRQVVSGSQLPPDLTLRLDPGVRVGGVVYDDRGRPVAGVKVQVNAVLQDSRGVLIEVEAEKVVTDAAGRWSSGCASPNFEVLTNFKLTHPDFFAADYDEGREAGERHVTTQSLRAGEAVMTLKPGIEVAGTVKDAGGRPVAGAEVALASGREYATRRNARTDADGRFRLVALETGRAALLVQARGWAPEQRKLALAEGIGPLGFELSAGRTIEGRVTAEANQPVADAVVTIEPWQDLDLLAWRAETDADGRFRGHDAPLQQVTLAARKEGFKPTTAELTAVSGSEISFIPLRLEKSFRFTGRVLDAETGRPITRFRLVRGDAWGGEEEDDARWNPQREEPSASADGAFSVGLDYESAGRVRFMAVAEDHLPEASPVYETTGAHEHTFRLKAGNGPRGVVVNAAGQPVADAQVAIVGFGYVSLGRGAFREYEPNRSHLTRTDVEGRFALPALLPNPGLVAVHPQHGFAELNGGELATSGKITLRPWGRVEGVMKIGSKPAVDQEISLINRFATPDAWLLDSEAYRTRTDAAGRFRFEQVPPGELQIGRLITYGRGSSWTAQRRLIVRPGEVTQVAFGGTGRPVIGKVVFSDPDRTVDWASGFSLLSTRLPQPSSDFRTPAEARAWRQSPEYKAAIADYRAYAPTWQADGSFRIDDVSAGKYRLHLGFTESGVTFPPPIIGQIDRDVEVPEIPGGQSDEPLDLGELRLELDSEPDPVADPPRATEPAPQPGAAAREGVQKPSGEPRDSAAPGEAASPAGTTPATTAPPPPQSTMILRDTAPADRVTGS